MEFSVRAVKTSTDDYYKKMEAIYDSCKDANLLHQLPEDVKDYFNNEPPFCGEKEIVIFNGKNTNMVTIEEYDDTYITINLNNLPNGISKILIITD